MVSDSSCWPHRIHNYCTVSVRDVERDTLPDVAVTVTVWFVGVGVGVCGVELPHPNVVPIETTPINSSKAKSVRLRDKCPHRIPKGRASIPISGRAKPNAHALDR